MRDLLKHLKSYILRGLLAIIPLALTAFAIKILYSTIDKRITAIVEEIIGFSFPGLGVLLLLATLYLLGLVVSNIVGKQMFGLVEKIPLSRQRTMWEGSFRGLYPFPRSRCLGVLC